MDPTREPRRPEELALERFDTGHLCGEAVLRTLCETRGLQEAAVPRMATGFCSGLARTCGPCGALMGAVLAVSLAHGRNEPEATDASRAEVDACYARIQRLVDAFSARFGTYDCFALIGCDLRKPEGQQRFRDEGRIARCRELVAAAVELGLEALEP